MKLQVGKTYLDKEGRAHKIVEEIGPDVFSDAFFNEWDNQGNFYSAYSEPHPYDLVKEADNV
jgi:hypothetical protein